jgi:hypothetical protein
MSFPSLQSSSPIGGFLAAGKRDEILIDERLSPELIKLAHSKSILNKHTLCITQDQLSRGGFPSVGEQDRRYQS